MKFNKLNVIMSLLLSVLSYSASAGTLLTVDSSKLTSYDYNYGDDCDTVTIGVAGKEYKFRACALQAIVRDQMNALLTSPRSQECVKVERCRGNYCERTYGVREVRTEMLMVVTGSKIDTYKVKDILGPCL